MHHRFLARQYHQALDVWGNHDLLQRHVAQQIIGEAVQGLMIEIARHHRPPHVEVHQQDPMVDYARQADGEIERRERLPLSRSRTGNRQRLPIIETHALQHVRAQQLVRRGRLVDGLAVEQAITLQYRRRHLDLACLVIHDVFVAVAGAAVRVDAERRLLVQSVDVELRLFFSEHFHYDLVTGLAGSRLKTGEMPFGGEPQYVERHVAKVHYRYAHRHHRHGRHGVTGAPPAPATKFVQSLDVGDFDEQRRGREREHGLRVMDTLIHRLARRYRHAAERQ